MRTPPFSKDDDLLSGLLVDIALFKHTQQRTRKMDPKWKPTTSKEEPLFDILEELKKTGDMDRACRRMERFGPCASNMRSKEGFLRKSEIDFAQSAFRAHIRRYLSIHMPDTPFELFTTDRYLYDPDAESEVSSLPDSDHKDHKYWTWVKESSSEDEADKTPPPPREGPLDLGTRAKEDFEKGEIIPRLLGKVHDLTDEQDEQLRDQTLDFSVTMNAGRNCFQALFGPTRFVNHDCDANVELTRRGGNMCFEVIKPIKAGDEILSNYGDSYFGDDNIHCKCATCQKNGRGAYCKNPVIEQEVVLEEMTGRVTRSKEVLVPLTRAERIELEAKEEKETQRRARLEKWLAAGGTERSYKDIDREISVPSYLKPRINKEETRYSREERSKRRAEGLASSPSPVKKRRASAPPTAQRMKDMPAYLRMGVPTGNGDRSSRSLRRLGVDLTSNARGRRKDKRSLEEQINDMTAAIRTAIRGEEEEEEEESENESEQVEADDAGERADDESQKMDVDGEDEESEDATPEPQPKRSAGKMLTLLRETITRRPLLRGSADKPASAPARIGVTDVNKRGSRRTVLVMSGSKVSSAQEKAAVHEAGRASKLAAKEISDDDDRPVASSSRVKIDSSLAASYSHDWSRRDSGSSSEECVANALISSRSRRGQHTMGVASVTPNGSAMSAAVASSGRRRGAAASSRSASGGRTTRSAALTSAPSPKVSATAQSPLTTLSRKRLADVSDASWEARVKQESESDGSTPVSTLLDTRDSSATSVLEYEEARKS